MRALKRYVRQKLNERGFYDIRDLGGDVTAFEDFRRSAREIMARHGQQDEATVKFLRRKYEEPVIGEVSVYRLLELSAQVVDPTNCYLYCTSQLTHTLQMLGGMEGNGIDAQTSRDLFIATLLHDLGKLALLKGERPDYVEGGGKRPIGQNEPGIGFENCVFTWDHGDIAYARFKPYVSERVAWLIHYHSITKACVPFMDERDRAHYESLFEPFSTLDRTYIFYRLPKRQLEDYRDAIEEAFPDPVLF